MKLVTTSRAIVASLALAVASTGFAEDKEQQQGQQSQQSGSSERGEKGQLSATDRAFIHMAALENMAEINISKIAQQKATNEELKQHAEKMVESHTKALEELKDLAQQKGVEWKADMPERAKEMKKDLMAEITSKSGQAFDQAYQAFEVAGHRMAEALFQNGSQFAQDPQVQQYAQKYLPEIRRHLATVEKGTQSTTQRSGESTSPTAGTSGQQPSQPGQAQPQQQEKVGTE